MRSSNDDKLIIHAVKSTNTKPQSEADWWLDVGKSLDKRKVDKVIDKWSPLDYGKMVSNWVYERNQTWIGCGPAKYAEFMKKITSMLKRGIGEKPTCQMKKDYLNFVLENYFDTILTRERGYFDFKFLVDEKLVADFLKTYQPTKAVAAVLVEEKKDAATLDVKEVDMEYRIGLQSLIQSFGLIIATNYLMKKEKITLEQACKQIKDECVEMCTVNAKFANSIAKATEKYSPYPKWLPFVAVGQIMDDVCKVIGKTKQLSVQIVDNDKKFGFLR